MGRKWLGMLDSNQRMQESKSCALPTWRIPIFIQNGVPEGSRTPDTWLRRPLLYPAELQAHVLLERVKGIEPSQLAWKARALPLSYTRKLFGWWREKDSNLRSRRQQIYSLPPLAAREPLHVFLELVIGIEPTTC